MISQKTLVEIIQDDGDITVLSRIQNELGVRIKKKLDHNHCVKNSIEHLFHLRNRKEAKISNLVIRHFTKCIKHIFTKNQGDPNGMQKN